MRRVAKACGAGLPRAQAVVAAERAQAVVAAERTLVATGSGGAEGRECGPLQKPHASPTQVQWWW